MADVAPGTYHLFSYLHTKDDAEVDSDLPSAESPTLGSLRHYKNQPWIVEKDTKGQYVFRTSNGAYAAAPTLAEGAGLVLSDGASQFDIIPDQQDGWLKIKAPGENLVWQLDSDGQITFGAVHVECCECEAGNKQRWQLRE